MADGGRPRERRRGRALVPLGLVFLAIGVSTAVAIPFLSLFVSTAVRADPVHVTVLLIAAPLSGVIASTWLGRWSDRRPVRRALLIGAATAGALGMGLTAVVRNYWVVLALTVTANALAQSLFPQAFAYARQLVSRAGSDRAGMVTSVMRTIFSFAWVAGPPLGAVLLSAGGFGYVYGLAAATYALAAVVAIGWLDEIGAAPEPTAATPDAATADPPRPQEVSRTTLLLTAAAFTALLCPLTLAVQVLPLFITADLGGQVRDAGLVLGLCAALEIPLMLGLGTLTSRIPVRVLVLVGAACGIGYYGLAAVVPNVAVLAAAQVLDALFIAAVSGLGISYLQDMLPRQPGRATTLFANSLPIGAMLAGPLFGLAQHFGYRLAYVIAAGLCTVGLTILLCLRPDTAARQPRNAHAGLADARS